MKTTTPRLQRPGGPRASPALHLWGNSSYSLSSAWPCYPLLTFMLLWGFKKDETPTWNLRMSRGFPAFFRQFWLHLRKNFKKNLWRNKLSWLAFKLWHRREESSKSLPGCSLRVFWNIQSGVRASILFKALVFVLHPSWTFLYEGNALSAANRSHKRIKPPRKYFQSDRGKVFTSEVPIWYNCLRITHGPQQRVI